MFLKIVKTFCLLIIGTCLFAQQEVGLYFQSNLWQSTYTNPAMVPESNLLISLPALRNNLMITGATYNDIIFQEVNGRNQIDIDKVIENLEANNLIRDDLALETIGAAFKLGGVTVNVSHAFKYLAYLDYPKTMPQLLWQGNAQFIGESASLSNDLQLTGYNEFAVGAAIKVKNLTIGGRAKYLGGISNFSTDEAHKDASLYTDPDIYQLTLDADYRLNSSGSFEYNDYSDFNLNFDFGQASTGVLFTSNAGFAFDIGARLELGKFEFAASAIDLGGSIDWDEDVRNYQTNGSFEYDGLDFSEALTGGSVDFQDAIDTLDQIFQVTETQTNYSTKIPTKYYVSASMKLANLRFGGLFFTESYRGKNFPAFALGANGKVFNMLNVGATYTILPEFDSYANVGVNVSAKLGLVQVYGTTDNVAALFNPGDSHTFSARVGVNVVIN